MIPPISDESRYKCSGAESLQQAERVWAQVFPVLASFEALHERCSAARLDSFEGWKGGQKWNYVDVWNGCESDTFSHTQKSYILEVGADDETRWLSVHHAAFWL